MKAIEYYGNGNGIIHYITDLSPQLRRLGRDQPKIRIATQLEGQSSTVLRVSHTALRPMALW